MATTLRSGSSGAEVTQLQQALAAAGYDPGPIDGVFGPRTAAAVTAFQQANGLTVDGIVGTQTWGALGGGTAVTGITSNTTTAGGSTDLRARVLATYPQYAYLLEIPEVAGLLMQAVDPNTGFSAQEFAARLYATNWWRTTADAQRQWDAMVGLDPASAQAQRDAVSAGIADFYGEMGISIGGDQMATLTDWALRNGIAIGSAQFRNEAATQAAGTLSSSTVYAQVKELARRVYMLPLSDADAQEWTRKIIAGDASIESYRVQLAQQAADTYTGLPEGAVPGDYFATYRAAIAAELELPADAIDLLDPKWRSVVQIEGTNGMRPMTISEAATFARSQPEYKTTARGRQQGAELALYLGEIFGEVA